MADVRYDSNDHMHGKEWDMSKKVDVKWFTAAENVLEVAA